MDGKAFDTPLVAEVIEGEVVLTAPRSSISISLTPDAAAATAERLAAAASEALSGRSTDRPLISPLD